MKSDLDKVLAAGTQAGAAPGAVAIVVNRNEVLWEGAAGERAAGSGTPMTTDTVGAIFSMTKAITGARWYAHFLLRYRSGIADQTGFV